ncbi:acetate--CoA ligase family protein [Fusibacter paucivorans]|uniref:Acetate--CoA ligase family protein n=1 Tax=Fusibacter paucivorans TaxID=76009 RepID=A0ABS5PM44_9FIRM|nr:acetate--CoA ligase family protein [Fusibacter paucivorans]MBS7526235.1 acetate--CoA ligase family protein [Fusibacter paucivorans]
MSNQQLMKHLMAPDSIAVLGASNRPESIGGRPIKFLKDYGFKGAVYPINPKYETIQGLPCYKDISSIPQKADLLIIITKPNSILQAMRDAKARKIPAVMIITSGFSESGDDGKKLEEALVTYARDNEMLVMGPNCQGFVNFDKKVTATFTGALSRGNLQQGNICLISQSGAMSGMLYAMAVDLGIGFSYLISGGNESIVTTSHFIDYAVDDDRTDAICVYMEGIKDAPLLKAAARKAVEQDKPIVAMKVGKSEAGSKAASSHTGALASSDAIVDSFMKQSGILRVETTDDLFDAMKVFSNGKRSDGNRIGVVSISGGAGVVMADACEKYQMTLPKLSGETEKELSANIPAFGSPHNPVDLTAQVLTAYEKFYHCIETVAADESVDAVVIFIGLLEHLKDNLLKAIEDLNAVTQKPILVTWLAATPEIKSWFYEKKIPLFEDSDRCIFGASLLWRYTALKREVMLPIERTGDDLTASVHEMYKGINGFLNEWDSKQMIAAAGVMTDSPIVAADAAALASIAEKLNYPVAVKVLSQSILHKSDIGGVVLNVGDKTALLNAYTSILDNVEANGLASAFEGVIVSPMRPKGTEMIVGIKKDPHLGTAVVLGMGGTMVEILKDSVMQLIPIDKRNAVKMIDSLKSRKMLYGYRDIARKDIDALAAIIVRVSDLCMARPDIQEMDINPIFVYDEGQGAVALDALIKLEV